MCQESTREWSQHRNVVGVRGGVENEKEYPDDIVKSLDFPVTQANKFLLWFRSLFLEAKVVWAFSFFLTSLIHSSPSTAQCLGLMAIWPRPSLQLPLHSFDPAIYNSTGTEGAGWLWATPSEVWFPCNIFASYLLYTHKCFCLWVFFFTWFSLILSMAASVFYSLESLSHLRPFYKAPTTWARWWWFNREVNIDSHYELGLTIQRDSNSTALSRSQPGENPSSCPFEPWFYTMYETHCHPLNSHLFPL